MTGTRRGRRRAGVASWLAAMVLAIAAVVALAACGPGGATASPGLVSPIDGIIVAVDASSISDVRGFTLRLPGGATMQFTLGQLENPTQFPPGHLEAHEATSQPVRVYFVAQGSELVVFRLEDAPGSSAPPGSAPPASNPTPS